MILVLRESQLISHCHAVPGRCRTYPCSEDEEIPWAQQPKQFVSRLSWRLGLDRCWLQGFSEVPLSKGVSNRIHWLLGKGGGGHQLALSTLFLTNTVTFRLAQQGNGGQVFLGLEFFNPRWLVSSLSVEPVMWHQDGKICKAPLRKRTFGNLVLIWRAIGNWLGTFRGKRGVSLYWTPIVTPRSGS